MEGRNLLCMSEQQHETSKSIDVTQLEPGWVSEASGIRIIERVALTQQSVVYKSEQVFLSRLVAFKVSLSHAHNFDRFQQESILLNQLDHPNIGSVFSTGLLEGHPYLLMEWLVGETLAAKLDREHRLTLEDTTLVLDALASALTYAHSRNIIHRDIKPSNIFIRHADDAQIEVKLIDFGIAKDVASDLSLTSTGTLIGSPAYMSPEQSANNDVSSASDVYSVGCVLYECLTGKPPFSNMDSAYDVLYQHLHCVPRPIASSPVSMVVLTCLEKSPEKRYQTMEALREHWHRACESKSSPIRPEGRLAATAVVCLLLPMLGVGLYRLKEIHQTSQETARKSISKQIKDIATSNKTISTVQIIAKLNEIESNPAFALATPTEKSTILFLHLDGLQHVIVSHDEYRRLAIQLKRLAPLLADRSQRCLSLLYATTMFNRALDPEQAVECARAAIELKQLLKEDHQNYDLGWFKLEYAESLHLMKRFDLREHVLQDALADLQKRGPIKERPDLIRIAQIRLAWNYAIEGKRSEALSMADSVVWPKEMSKEVEFQREQIDKLRSYVRSQQASAVSGTQQ